MRTPVPIGPTRRVRRAGVAITATLAALVLTACVPEPEPAPSATQSTTPGAGPVEPPEAALVVDGTAADNLPLFAQIVAQVSAGGGAVPGRDYIDALVAAGFPREAMQLTADTTTVGDPVDAVQFSVLWAGECLIGQVGPSTPGAAAVVMPELPDGGCLVGSTHPLDG